MVFGFPLAAKEGTVASLSEQQFTCFRDLILERFGLYFPDKRRADLERGLYQAFAASTCADLAAYHRLLSEASTGSPEMERLVNALTVGETHFFRDAGQFDTLYNEVLPQLIARRRSVRTLRLWSAGCASGEEPYSLAMMLRELLPDIEQWSITILGTDVNTEALERASKAIYSDWAFREERAKAWRERYFTSTDRRFALRPEVQRMVQFAWLNLADASYPSYETNTAMMDLILCRNVTIYFAEDVVHAVIRRLHDALTEGGWLVVGHSEPSPLLFHQFEARSFPSAILYQHCSPPLTEELTGDLHEGQGFPANARDLSALESQADIVEGRYSDAGAQFTPASPASLLSEDDVPGARDESVERAWELLQYGRSEEARDLLLALLEHGPFTARQGELLGQAYANLGDWAEAERWCYRALALDKLSLKAYYTLALVLQHAGQLPRAIEAMRTVVYLDRNSVLGHFGLADLYHSQGQLGRACKSLENARRLLDAQPDSELLPETGGMSVGRLRSAVVRQQQQWEAERRERAAVRLLKPKVSAEESR